MSESSGTLAAACEAYIQQLGAAVARASAGLRALLPPEMRAVSAATEDGFGAWHVDGYLVAARSCAEAVGQLIVSEGLSSESIDLSDIRRIDDIDTTTVRVEDSEKGDEWHDVPVRELLRGLDGPEIIAWPQD